jgi:hypothetical protein
MAHGISGSFSLVYDGTGLPLITSYIVSSGLVTGDIYRFKVSAINYNGEGPLSIEVLTRACIAPSNMI